MRRVVSIVLALSLSCLVATSSLAADDNLVEITGVHLCCGGCVAALEEALDEVEGLSELSIDREKQTARFRVPDAKTRTAAFEAVAKAGFYGTAMHGEEPVPMIADAETSESKTDRLVLTGVHLCCPSCTKAVVKAFEDVESVVAVDCDIEAGTVALTGKDIDAALVFEHLHQAGFHGTVEE
jgi:copper chaperone CopZ